MDKAEQEAEEILIELGFAEPEDLEPEVAELLHQHVKDVDEWIATFLQLDET